MWSLGAVLSFVANKGNHLIKCACELRAWTGERDSLIPAIYSIALKQLISDLLHPKPELRPTAEKVASETKKENRQKQGWKGEPTKQ